MVYIVRMAYIVRDLRWSYTKKRKFLTFLQSGNLCASSEREGEPGNLINSIN